MSRHTRGFMTALAGLGLVVAISLPAHAQRGRGFSRLFEGWPKADLANLPQVQAELKMTAEQKAKCDAIREQLRNDRRALLGSSFGQPNEIREGIRRLAHEASAKLESLLDDRQKKRLGEIAIQVNGSRALYDPDVVNDLNLSAAQEEKLKNVREASSQATEDLFSEYGKVSRDDWRLKSRELGEKTDKELLDVLTDAQRKKFEAMKGKTIEIDFSGIFLRGRGS